MPKAYPLEPVEAKPTLRTPQARILAALMPTDSTYPIFDWPLYTRAALGTAAGYTAISGSVTRALNGIRPGSSSGDAHLGLIALGLVEEVVLDIDGVAETNYRTTAAGIVAYRAYISRIGELPAQRDKSSCINDRYKNNSESE